MNKEQAVREIICDVPERRRKYGCIACTQSRRCNNKTAKILEVMG